MNLYRMTYLRDSLPRSMVPLTFAAIDAHHAACRAAEWADWLGVELLTVSEVQSRQPEPLQPSLAFK